MTKKEQERLNALLLKKEAEEKADKEFFAKVRKRKDEVIKVLKIDTYFEDRLKRIADNYGCTVFELLDYIETEQQVGFYQRTHKK